MNFRLSLLLAGCCALASFRRRPDLGRKPAVGTLDCGAGEYPAKQRPAKESKPAVPAPRPQNPIQELKPGDSTQKGAATRSAEGRHARPGQTRPDQPQRQSPQLREC